MIYDEDFLKSLALEGYITKKVEVREAPGKGKGLFAIEFISKGEIVSISGGVIISSSIWKDFKKKYRDYAYFIEENFLIAPLNPKDPSADWRMNHCCEANCGLKGQIVFVAMRDIQVGEELVYDYAMTETDPEYELHVSCKYPSCRKKITGNDWKNIELQKKYDGYFSLYIQEKIDKKK